ncbi:MAG: riboflavin synthase [Brevinema sp.]
MFTGLIEEVGTVKNIHLGAKSAQLLVQCSIIREDIHLGDSIAVNGVCLTVTKLYPNAFEVDAMPETLDVSALKYLVKGQKVNLERALSVGSRLGGHIVSGHVDGVGIIKQIQPNENAVLITVTAPMNILKYIIHRGSIAIDGISLTVCGLDDHEFQVSIIPHTFSHTTLSLKKIGEQINLENDMIAKYTERLLSFQAPAPKKDITIEFLKSNGF